MAPYLLTKLMSRGGEYGDIFYEKVFSTVLNYENKKLQKGIEGFDEGVGIRLIKNGKTYYGYTSEITKKSLEDIVHSLVEENGEGKIKVGIKQQIGYTKVLLDPEDYFPERKKEILLKADDIFKKRNNGNKYRRRNS